MLTVTVTVSCITTDDLEFHKFVSQGISAWYAHIGATTTLVPTGATPGLKASGTKSRSY
jgi:hypothetical protein